MAALTSPDAASRSKLGPLRASRRKRFISSLLMTTSEVMDNEEEARAARSAAPHDSRRRWPWTGWPAALVAGHRRGGHPARCWRHPAASARVSSTTGHALLRSYGATCPGFPGGQPTGWQPFAVMLLGGCDGVERRQDGQYLKAWPSCMVARPTWAKLQMTGLLMFPHLGQAKMHLGHGGLWGSRWPSWRLAGATARRTPVPRSGQPVLSPAHQPARPGRGAGSAQSGPRPGPASPAFPTWPGRRWPACPAGNRLLPDARGCPAP